MAGNGEQSVERFYEKPRNSPDRTDHPKLLPRCPLRMLHYLIQNPPTPQGAQNGVRKTVATWAVIPANGVIYEDRHSRARGNLDYHFLEHVNPQLENLGFPHTRE
ncbi:hypothetical protein SAMN05216420_104173 [Nitrosospira sp. Nl5]|uniref:hypothetical protein n=1 Tax=Nitrosospira sp. Nl5 TaxID=200120 RepID=UPI00087FE528|nr:hypothetical protein [Nitrosospira sp. Nl5]SCY30317.1 hypothetical protein SAMN05216420_104173 [Nitrosospira sp. Nl5]